MNDAPSKPLLVLLALSVLAAAYVYGVPLVVGDSETDFEDEVFVPDDLGFVDDTDDAEIEPWSPPSEPRNPFVPVELGTVSDDQSETGTDLDAPDPDADPGELIDELTRG